MLTEANISLILEAQVLASLELYLYNLSVLGQWIVRMVSDSAYTFKFEKSIISDKY